MKASRVRMFSCILASTVAVIYLLSGCGTKKAESKTILITAFEPFGGEELNPTEMLLEKLPDTIEGYTVRKLLLPVEFEKSRELIITEYEEVKPDAVIMLGQAGGRDAITPETTAVNEMSAVGAERIVPDNAGFAPEGLPIVDGGPGTLHSTLPVERIVEAVNSAGIPCEISDNAGKYVCNNVFYSMLEHNGGEVPTGFIHVPYIKEQGHEDSPYLKFDELYTGIMAAIETVIDSDYPGPEARKSHILYRI